MQQEQKKEESLICNYCASSLNDQCCLWKKTGLAFRQRLFLESEKSNYFRNWVEMISSAESFCQDHNKPLEFIVTRHSINEIQEQNQYGDSEINNEVETQLACSKCLLTNLSLSGVQYKWVNGNNMKISKIEVLDEDYFQNNAVVIKKQFEDLKKKVEDMMKGETYKENIDKYPGIVKEKIEEKFNEQSIKNKIEDLINILNKFFPDSESNQQGSQSSDTDFINASTGQTQKPLGKETVLKLAKNLENALFQRLHTISLYQQGKYSHSKLHDEYLETVRIRHLIDEIRILRDEEGNLQDLIKKYKELYDECKLSTIQSGIEI